jgi:eukaryotic-like serine/threonine-protein kinase
MSMSDNQPANTDAILGGQTPPPIDAAVLGGTIGRNRKLTHEFGWSYELVEELSKTHDIFSFETVTVNDRGDIIDCQTKQAFHYTEDLGNGIDLEMVYIPAGRFIMETPKLANHLRYVYHSQERHLIDIPAFYIGKYPITQSQYQAIMGDNPAYFKGIKSANRPVECLSWVEAREFCRKLSQSKKINYTLPSESQWEYACRANSTQRFSSGNNINPEIVNYRVFYTFTGNPKIDNRVKRFNREQTTIVGQFPANSFGLYDMHGNVREICMRDRLYAQQGIPDRTMSWTSNTRIERIELISRGGSWMDYSNDCQTASRLNCETNSISRFLGFRIVSNID